MNNKTLLVLVYIGTHLSISALAEPINLNGLLLKNQQTVSQASIRIKELGLQTTTDDSGKFQFENIETGNYTFDIEAGNKDHFNIDYQHESDQVTKLNLSSYSEESVVVIANPLEHNSLKMTTPTALISEKDLVLNRGLNINETISNIAGVDSASFGVAAGQPVIRGQQGNRVTVLSNNSATQDAANVSPDHWISVEPLLAKQVEVLKGPATLLYGGQAVGGVVNVVDNTIPSERTDNLLGGIELRVSDTALSERSAVLSLDFPISYNIMGHISYFNTQTDDYEIPGLAESENLATSEGEILDPNDAIGFLDNSDIDASGSNVGGSYVYDNGYWGASVSIFDRNYGIPAHEHHDEEESIDDAEEESVRIDLDKTTFNLRGQHEFTETSEYFKLIRMNFTTTDYQHVELEGTEIGTVFDSNASELRIELTHNHALGFDGVVGLQYKDRDFSAIGDEAFILPSTTQQLGLFMIEEREFDSSLKGHFEFGARFDIQQIETIEFADIDQSGFSFSMGSTLELNDNWTLPINLSHAIRLPTAEELFSNQSGSSELIPHLATGTIEVGNKDLDEETANNFDIGLRFRKGAWSFNAAVYYNKMQDFIFLNPTGLEFEEFPIFEYQQQDATFKGFELEGSVEVTDSWSNQWTFSGLIDKTQATLDDGSYLPRIPAQRVGLNVGFNRNKWFSNLHFTHVNSQMDLAEFEIPTDSYNLLNFDINHVFYKNIIETTLFIKGSNLLNEEIRDHASFIKDIAPRPGRSLSAGIRVNF
jgi:iron complex outermembrane receptor protein